MVCSYHASYGFLVLKHIHVAMQKTCQQVDMSVQEVHSSSIHFMENGPSILRDMPWIELQNSEVANMQTICSPTHYLFHYRIPDSLRTKQKWCGRRLWLSQITLYASSLYTDVLVTYSHHTRININFLLIGNGKTHYIKEQLATCGQQITIAVNEAFSPLKAINKLLSLPLHENNVGLFFNFTVHPPGVSICSYIALQ